MIERKNRLLYVIGSILFMSFVRLCFLRPPSRSNVHVSSDKQAQPLGNSSSTNTLGNSSSTTSLGNSSSITTLSNSSPTTNPKADNWKSLPLNFKKSESGCRRQCHERRNKIVYDWHAAGLGDRGSILRGLSDLAGYLCAVVEVPRPKFLLSLQHNDGLSIDINATFNDFFNLTFRQDGSPSIVDLVDPNSTNENKRPDPIKMYGGEDYRQWYVVASKKGGAGAGRDFLKLEDYSFRQPPDATTGFIWIIRADYYKMRSAMKDLVVSSSSPKRRVNVTLPWGSANRELPPLEMLPLSPIGCSYQQNRAPLYTQNLAREILQHIRQQAGPSSVVGSFHIRRGDTVQKCDTTFERMKSYLQCSFNGTESRNITLLFRSDERNQTYRSAIQTMIHDLGHTFIDLDALIKTFLEDAVKIDGGAKWRLSNYYVYALSQELMSKVSFKLLQHYKHGCADCNELAGRADLWK
jgi:hypothetical protein